MTMVERVARAINKAEFETANTDDEPFAVARAAIEAMREPTEAMLKAGQCVPSRLTFTTLTAESLLLRWQAMIDAALKEQP